MGEMADELIDSMWDIWDNDDYGEHEGPRYSKISKYSSGLGVVCKYCGCSSLKWSKQETGKWHLLESYQDGDRVSTRIHICKNKKEG